MKEKKISGKSLGIVLCIVLLSFLCIFRFIYPVNYENLAGEHSWLSGSTLKFVNEWLSEGALKNHFTCYEAFDSIEFHDVSERTPYLSYPTGSTFLVYSAAKLLGRSHIDISFLKHFQMVCYGIEALLFAAFLYLFVSRLGRFGEVQKIVISATMAVAWILLPVNVYYLANVFFADQCVILWVMLFLLLEYISHMRHMSKKGKLITKILKCPVIYMGVMTDYYFWILVFLAFVLRFIRNVLVKKKLIQNIRESLWYVCPVILAVLTFLWQLSYTENWMESLLGIFLFRTGGLEEGNVYVRILINFYGAFADASKIRLVCLLFVEIAMVILVLRDIIKKKKWKLIFLKNEYSILVLGFVAPVLQILLLKNHSAIHEFSMLKIDWIIIMSIIIITLLLTGEKREKAETAGGRKIFRSSINYLISFALMAAITGIPFSAGRYVDYRYAEKTYPLEKILFETMEYEDVCFSLTYEIPVNPPHQLAVSEKQVYLVESLEEIDTYFEDLPDNARKVLMIEKNNPDKSEQIKEMENTARGQNEVLYEDDSYCILQLNEN